MTQGRSIKLQVLFPVSLLLSLVLAYVGCAHKAPKNDHAVAKVLPSVIRIRRPPGEGADPQAGPGGVDYTSHPKPDAKFDCQPVAALFSAEQLKAVRDCLVSLKAPMTVKYRLLRDAEPVLTLKDPTEQTPDCVKKDLARIPVPREIFFEGRTSEDEPLQCYSSRVPIEADRVLGMRLPKDRLEVEVALNKDLAGKNDAETLRVLAAWALAPFFTGKDGGGPYIPSKIVTDEICKKCLGEKDFGRKGEPPSGYWP